MWSSVQENNKSNSNRLVSSSSSASKTYSSSSSSSLPQTPRRKNMEEVWKDISRTTLHHEGPFTPSIRIESHHHLQAPCFRGMILQDFLAGAFKETSTVASTADGTPLLPPPPPPLPHTALSLNSGMGLQPFGLSMIHNSCTTCSNSSSNSSGSHAHQPQLFVSETVVGSPLPAGIYSFCSKKRELESSNSEGDPRNKRMIKNRESAARSRARKQAYTNELELEVTHLQEENAKLRKERDELQSAMASQQTPKNTLKRSSSAPF